MFFCTPMKHSSLSRRKSSNKTPELFALCANMVNLGFFVQKTFYSKFSNGQVEGNFRKPPKRIRQKAENIPLKKRRRKLTFFPQFFLRRSSAQFWQLNRKEIARRPEVFRSLSENGQNKIRFSNSCFSSNCSLGYVDCCFDKPAEKNDRQPKLSLHVRKRFNKFEKIFCPNCPYWHVKCRFDNPVGKNSSKDRLFYAHCPHLMEYFI